MNENGKTEEKQYGRPQDLCFIILGYLEPEGFVLDVPQVERRSDEYLNCSHRWHSKVSLLPTQCLDLPGVLHV